jgi:hypothetical protein
MDGWMVLLGRRLWSIRGKISEFSCSDSNIGIINNLTENRTVYHPNKRLEIESCNRLLDRMIVINEWEGIWKGRVVTFLR